MKQQNGFLCVNGRVFYNTETRPNSIKNNILLLWDKLINHFR
jgi:hypothetical protein